MWKLDYKESWVPKNWCFWTVVLEKTLENRLACKEIQPVHPKGNRSWIFIGRTDAEAETPIFGHLMQRTDSLEKTLVLERLRVVGEGGNNRGWDGWMASLTQWTWVWVSPGVGDGQGGLGCGSPWGRKESDTTDQLNWAELMGPDAMILVFWMLGFKPTFSLFPFTFYKRLFSSSLSAIRWCHLHIWGYWYFFSCNVDTSLWTIII